jgi:hypothetical protein
VRYGTQAWHSGCGVNILDPKLMIDDYKAFIEEFQAFL